MNNIINKLGEKLTEHSKSQNALIITWSKAYGEVYCHNIVLAIPQAASSLFNPEITKIVVRVRTNDIEKGSIKSFSDNEVIKYLPCKIEDDIMYVPLNSSEIISVLTENIWTKLKNGSRSVLKSFPLSLTAEVDQSLICQCDFEHNGGKVPVTLSEEFINPLKDGEKSIVTLCF